MAKTRVYVFSDKGAKCLVNPSNLEQLRKDSNTLVDPDISEIAHIPMHIWTLKDNKIVIKDKAFLPIPKAKSYARLLKIGLVLSTLLNLALIAYLTNI